MRVSIFGCGSIGKRHARNLLSLGVRDIVASDPRADRRAEMETLGVRTVPDHRQALEGAQVAFVCSPTSLHLAQAWDAAEQGCHLFIEKPLSTSPEGCEKLASLVEGNGLKSLVGCNFRFHPGLVKTQDLLREGLPGSIVSARARFGQYLPDWHPWEDYRQMYSARRDLGGGVLLDRVHELDYLCWLLGPVDEVFAFMGKNSTLELDTEDTVELLLRFSSGAFGSIHLDYVRRTYACDLEVTGDEGTVLWSFHDQEIRWYDARSRTWSSLAWPKYDTNEMYREELAHFLRVLRDEEPSAQDIHQAITVQRIAGAAVRSSAEGRTIRV